MKGRERNKKKYRETERKWKERRHERIMKGKVMGMKHERH